MTKNTILEEVRSSLASKINVYDLDEIMNRLGAVSYFTINDGLAIMCDQIPSWYFPKYDLWIEVEKDNLDWNNKIVRIINIRVLEE